MTRLREIWRTVPSLPDYEASNKGRVRRKVYKAPMPNGSMRRYGGHAHIGQWCADQNRYIFVYKGKSYKVARVVCEAFHGPAPAGKPYVLHDDENSRNNRPDNLKWGTQKENLNYPGFKAKCRARLRDMNDPFGKTGFISAF